MINIPKLFSQNLWEPEMLIHISEHYIKKKTYVVNAPLFPVMTK